MTTPVIKSQFFRIGTSGPTVDGREISADMLTEMAETYDPVEYAAQINAEHYHGMSPYSDFPNLGQVLEIKTDTDAKKRTVLLARIAPNTALINMNNRGQKLYPSMEIRPNFSGTDKAYLVGLAMTDTPASVGTQAVLYSAQNGGPGDDRFKTNLFSKEIQTENFTMDPASKDDTKEPVKEAPASDIKDKDGEASFSDKFAKIFKPKQKKADDNFSELQKASLILASKFTELEEKFSEGQNDISELKKTVATQAEEISAFRKALELMPESDADRPPATGETPNQTDC